MNKAMCLLCIIALMGSVFGIFETAKASGVKDNALSVVDHVDVDKYLGVWYEIAYIPNRFQKHCAGGTTAEYTKRDDGKLKVVNSCYTKDNKRKQSTGRAWIVDGATNAKLKVSFFPGKLKLFAGDYWIIDLGPNYEYAVVGHPKRKYGWILSRTKELPADILKGVKLRLEGQGYDTSEFRFTNQRDYGK